MRDSGVASVSIVGIATPGLSTPKQSRPGGESAW